MLHSALRILVSLVTLALAVLPVIVVLKAGWLTAGPGESSLERSVLSVLVYLVWLLAVFVLFVWLNDRLGINWHAWDRAPRREKRRRRRRAAGLNFLEGQESARRGDGDRGERGGS